MTSLPAYVKTILATLSAAGYEAYVVGGPVRDTLLGRRPADWDICSSAPPERVRELFPHTVPTGIKHGTVTVLIGSNSAEVTAFRADGEYTDHRRPDSVRFTDSLTKDLSRRDFTVNAMAMDAAGRVIDPFGGQTDLKARILRCVGEPERRFSEDALRMLRAVRFSAQLGFELAPGTLAALRECAPLALALSPERVRDELMKTLRSKRPEAAGELISAGLMDSFLSRRNAPALSSLRSLPIYARLPRLCAELEAGGYIMSTESFLTALRLDKKTISLSSRATRVRLSKSHDWKRLIRDFGADAARAAYPKNAALRRVLNSGECCTAEALAISGEKLIGLGFKGPEVGRELSRLLEHVIDHPEDNREELLCKLIKRKETDI